MNDELKEIVKEIECYRNEELCLIFLSRKESNALLDYISNLENYKSQCEKALNILNNIYMLNNVTITNNAVEEIDKAINILHGENNE